ncbi:SlyX family protein [Rubrivivax sp. A210]|uniref:SlyX family protein n=1 Tax=Rubrivivax sp. A210 TaxID=2772301 RepID=UPI001919A9F7|nr:SlyX family protein [Rubrivivax sp. A210]
MTNAEVDCRLTDLEIKVSFTEDALDRLNEVVVRQQRQIDLLTRELLYLRERRVSEVTPEVLSPRDELPPHY